MNKLTNGIIFLILLLFSIGLVSASQISNWTDLNNIRNNLTGDYTLIANLSSADIDYVGIGDNWTTIGDGTNKFTGTFSGNGSTISDLKINLSSSDYVGLFGYLAGNVSNLGLINVNITTARSYCNYNSNPNCLKDTGGIAGYSSGIISNSYVTGYIYGKESRTGGIVGGLSGIVTNCYSNGTMDCYDCDVGGLVGKQYGGLINNSYSRSSVGSYYYELGGLVGTQASGTVSNSYSTGSVGGSSYDQGGFFGTGSIATNSYWDIDSSGKTPRSNPFPPDIAVGKTTTEMKNIATFNDWNISLSFTTDLNNGYPYLAWQADDSSYDWLIFLDCIPNWICNNHNASGYCNSTLDLNDCYITTGVPSDTYTGNYSEFPPTVFNDSIIGNESDINSTEDINVTIGNHSLENYTSMTGTLDIKFTQGNDILAEFDFNFSENVLNLSNISVERNGSGNGDVKGYIFVKGIQQEGTKTLYLYNVSPNFNWLCIKDAEINDISEISDNCHGTDEYLIKCKNQTSDDGYKCEPLGNNSYKITGLQHSGVIQSLFPIINITYPANNTIYNINISQINYTIINFSLSKCWYSTDNGTTNSSDQDVGLNFTDVTSIEGNNIWTVYCNDTDGNWTSSNVTFLKDTTSPYFTGIPQNTTINYTQGFGVLFNATDASSLPVGWSINWTNSFSINQSGYLKNTTRLAGGAYIINVTINDSLGNQNSTLYQVIVNPISPIITKYLNGANTNLSVMYPQQVNASGSTTGGVLTIYRNASSIINGANSTLGVGYYLFNFSVVGNENYTSSEDYLYADITNNTGACGVFFNVSSPITFPSRLKAYTNCNSNYILYKNGISTGNNSEQNLAAGVWNFTVQRTDTQNYTNTRDTQLFTINQATGIVYTYLNNSRSNIILEVPYAINLSTILNTGTGTIDLYKNGALINNGLSPRSNMTNFTSLGIYNITAIYSGNENYTASSESWNVTVIDTTKPLISFGARTTNTSSLSQNWIYANVTASDYLFSNISIYLYNTTGIVFTNVSGSSAYYLNYTNLADGTYFLNATVNDTSGNMNGTGTRTILLDITPPVISNLNNYTADGIINNNDSVILNATVTDATTNVSRVWISGNWSGNWTNHTITITSGSYVYTIYSGNLSNQEVVGWKYFANDTLGNVINSTTFSFRVEDRPLYFKNMTNFSVIQDAKLTINLSNFTVDLDNADPNLTFGGNLGFCSPNCALNATTGIFEWTPNYLNYGWYNLTFNVTDGLVNITNTTYIYVYGTLNITNTTFNSVLINESQMLQNVHPGDLVTIVVNTVSLGNQTIDNVTLTLNISGMYYGSIVTPGNWSQVPSVNRTFSFMIPTLQNESVYNASILASGNNHWPEYIRYDYFNFSINLTRNVDDIIIENLTLGSNNQKCSPQTNITINLTNKGLKNYSDITLKVYNSSLGLNYTLFNVSVISASYNDTLVFDINTSNKTAGNYTIVAKINYYNSFLTNITYTKNITLTIVNCEPEFINNPISDITLAEDNLNYTLNLSHYFTDFNNDSLIYRVYGNTTNLSFNNFASSGLVNITPAANYVGTNLINFTVNDTKGGINYTNMILVNITNVNDVPTINVSSQTFQENVTKTFYIIGNDIDPTNDTLIYDTNATFGTLTQINNSYALFNFTPQNSDVGVYSVLFNVSDGMNVTNATITITVVNSNNAPTLTTVSNQSVNESQLLNFVLSGNDVDVNDTLTYSCNLTSLTVTKINNTFANITWTPSEPQVGNYSVNCSVTDLVGARDSKIFTISVLPYHIVYYPTINPVVGSGMTQIFNFSLPTGATLVASTWKDNGAIAGAPNTYSYTFGPETVPGTYHVRVEVQDSTGANYTHDWYPQVTGYPIDDPYVATPDLSNSSLNLSNIVNLTIKNGNSKIEFLNPVDLSGVADLGGHVYIQGTIAGVDTSVLSMLNGPARITLTGLSLTETPIIYYSINYTTSGSDITYVCPTSICQLISWTSTTMVFNVTGFSSYRVTGTSSSDGDSNTNPNQSAILEINDVDLSEEEPKTDELVEITIDIENNGEIDIDNIELEIRLLDEDGNVVEDSDGDDLEDDSEFDLSDDESTEETFSFRMPIDAEDGDEYTIDVVACGDSEDDTEECAYDNSTTIKITREKHEVIIDSATITPSSINCFDSFDINLVLKNIGEKDEDVILTVKNDELEISKLETVELEADDEDDYKKSLSYAFSAPKDLAEGTYTITVKADYSDDTTTKTLQLVKGACTQELDEEEFGNEAIVVTLDQNKVVTTPAPEPNMLPEKASGFTDSFEYVIMLVILSLLALGIITFAIGAIIIRL